MLERTILGNLQIVHSYNQFKIPFQRPLKKKKQELILFRPAVKNLSF